MKIRSKQERKIRNAKAIQKLKEQVGELQENAIKQSNAIINLRNALTQMGQHLFNNAAITAGAVKGVLGTLTAEERKELEDYIEELQGNAEQPEAPPQDNGEGLPEAGVAEPVTI